MGDIDRNLHILIDWCAKEGRLDMIKILVTNYKDIGPCSGIDLAAENGHFEIIQFLHNNSLITSRCTHRSINGAAKIGNLEIVKFLHHNLKESCTKDAMEYAARNGHLEVVEFLKGTLKKYYTVQETPLECGVCFCETQKLEVYTCKVCKNKIHKECFEKWYKNCVFCRSRT